MNKPKLFGELSMIVARQKWFNLARWGTVLSLGAAAIFALVEELNYGVVTEEVYKKMEEEAEKKDESEEVEE